MPELVYLSLGSNLGDRTANLLRAIQRLTSFGTVGRVSSFYETEPVGLSDQPWFVNCTIALEFDGSPRDLLQHALAIELEMGRQRLQQKGPRNIDIDILLYADCVVDEPGLEIPHPAMHQRRFVLEPLAEIAPDVCHPVLKKTVREILAGLQSGQVVRRLDHDLREIRGPNSKSRNPRAR